MVLGQRAVSFLCGGSPGNNDKKETPKETPRMCRGVPTAHGQKVLAALAAHQLPPNLSQWPDTSHNFTVDEEQALASVQNDVQAHRQNAAAQVEEEDMSQCSGFSVASQYFSDGSSD